MGSNAYVLIIKVYLNFPLKWGNPAAGCIRHLFLLIILICTYKCLCSLYLQNTFPMYLSLGLFCQPDLNISFVSVTKAWNLSDISLSCGRRMNFALHPGPSCCLSFQKVSEMSLPSVLNVWDLTGAITRPFVRPERLSAFKGFCLPGSVPMLSLLN